MVSYLSDDERGGAVVQCSTVFYQSGTGFSESVIRYWEGGKYASERTHRKISYNV